MNNVTEYQDQLKTIQALYDQGQYLQSYLASKSLGSLEQWNLPQGRLLASRLAVHLGSDRLNNIIAFRGYKEYPQNAAIQINYGRYLLRRRGPWDALQFLTTLNQPDSAAERSEWFALHANLYGALRDFELAEKFIQKALDDSNKDPWIWLESATLLERQDNYEGAIADVEKSLETHPWYRPAVQQLANLLLITGKEQDALDLLQLAAQRFQSYYVEGQLLQLQIEHKAYSDANDTLQRVQQLVPLADKSTNQWLNQRASDIAYHQKDWPLATKHAKKACSPFYEHMAVQLGKAAQSTTESTRTELEVGFVKQHHNTCGPAVMSALCGYWGSPVPMQDIVDEIWYHGTQNHAERYWAESHGWYVIEFTLTWQSACELVSRGIPIAVTTVEPDSAHLQAVIGVDKVCDTFIMRDPYQRQTSEVVADSFLEHYRAYGPRAMVILPKDRQHFLDDIELPHSHLCSLLYQFRRALDRYDRAVAIKIYEQMKSAAYDHSLVIQSEQELAIYDGNETSTLAATEKLLEKFENNGNLILRKDVSLGRLGRVNDQHQWLADKVDLKDSHPLLKIRYADLLRVDARSLLDALKLLSQAKRAAPYTAEVYYVTAHALWSQGKRDEARKLYRIAGCLDSSSECYSRSYFLTCQQQNRSNEALAFLQDRFDRFGNKSAWPAISLCNAYEDLECSQDALKVLKQALEKRPDDGELLLHAADLMGRHGCFVEANEYLQQGEGKAAENDWLKASARLADMQGELDRSRSLWKRLVEYSPLDIVALRAYVQLVAKKEGINAALSFLHQHVDLYPANQALLELQIDWLDNHATHEDAEVAVQKLLAIDDHNTWALRELAKHLVLQGKHEDALLEVEKSVAIEPENTATWEMRGWIYQMLGRMEQAKLDYQHAIEISADCEYAPHQWLSCCTTAEEKSAALSIIHRELVKQTVQGDGVLVFQEAAQTIIDGELLLAHLKEAKDERPDLWQTWSVLSKQLLCLGRRSEALKVATEAVELFPLLPRVHSDLAQVHCELNAFEAEQKALKQALAISPGWSKALCRLADSYERTGNMQAYRTLIENGLVRNPLDSILHGFLSTALWSENEQEKALDCILYALELDPGYHWAWDRLKEWSEECKCPEKLQQLLQKLCETRPGEARVWLFKGRYGIELEDQLTALEKAIELNKTYLDAYKEKICLLTGAGRYMEALAVVGTSAFGEIPPADIRVYRPWIMRKQGDLKTAGSELRLFLESEPTYIDGWAMLSDWSDDDGDVGTYLKACRKLVDLAPDNAYYKGRLGDALVKSKKPEEAEAALRTAINQQPADSFSTLTLFDFLLDKKRLDDAAEILELCRLHQSGCHLSARAVQLSVAKGDYECAGDEFRSIVEDQNANPWSIETAIAAFSTPRNVKKAQEILDRQVKMAINGQPTSANIVGHWIKLSLLNHSESWTYRRLKPLLKNSELGKDVIYYALEGFAGCTNKDKYRQLVREFSELATSDDENWGQLMWTSCNAELYKIAVKYGMDWRNRCNAPSWGLNALAVSCYDMGLWEEGLEINHHITKLPPDHISNQNRLALAVIGGSSGNIDLLHEYFPQVDGSEFSGDWNDFLYGLGEALEKFFATSDVLWDQRIKIARKQIKAAQKRVPGAYTDSLIKKLCKRAYWQMICTQYTGWRAKLIWFLS